MLKGCDFLVLLLLWFAVLNPTIQKERTGHHTVPSAWAKDLYPTQTPHYGAADPRGGPCTPDEENPQTFSHVAFEVFLSVLVHPGSGRHYCTVWTGSVFGEADYRSVLRKIGVRLLLWGCASLGAKLWPVQAKTRFPLCCSVHTHVMCSWCVCSATLSSGWPWCAEAKNVFYHNEILLNYLNVTLNLSGTLRYTNSTKGVNSTKMSKSQNHFLYRNSTYSKCSCDFYYKCSCINGSFMSNFTVFLLQKPNRDPPSVHFFI